MILLDTTVAVRYLACEEIPALNGLLEILKDRERQPPNICASSISAGEIVKMCRDGDLILTVDLNVWLSSAQQTSRVRWLPVLPHIASAAEQIEDHGNIDFYDRLIIATARCYNVPLLTADNDMLAYSFVSCADYKEEEGLLSFIELFLEPLKT